MFMFFNILIFLVITALPENSLSSEEAVTWNDTFPNWESIQDIGATMGGMDQFQVEVKIAMSKASSMYNDLPVSLMEFHEGTTAIVTKICFVDNICWAMKMYKEYPGLLNLNVWYGICATTLIHQYCPNVPIPKFKGCSRSKFLYCFTEWVEGQTLHDKILNSPIKDTGKTSITIPENVVVSLAEFVYNVTTCPIPEHLSKKCSIVS